MTTERPSVVGRRRRAASLLAATVAALTVATLVEAGPATAADPPRADLGGAITAPAHPFAGRSFTLRVTLTSAGPAAAREVVVGVDVGRGLTVTAAPGGFVATGGQTVGYSLPVLVAGGSRTFAVTVAVPVTTTTRRTLTAAAQSLTVPDPAPANDRAEVSVRARPAA